MARKKMKMPEWIMWLVGVVTALGIGGLFWNGTMLNVPVLSFIPEFIHKVVAGLTYASIGVSIWDKFMK